ncbi:MAG: hypothetical protein M1835_002730 [Candelina submexicana]|nr:MAG: hypothetical protein M1835_002730 [Candelina submexicana]
MLGALRRGSTLAPRIIRLPSSTPLQSSKPLYSLYRTEHATPSSAALSNLYSHSIRWQSNAAAALVEEEVVEGELEHEIHAQKPPSDSEIQQQTEHGPIVRFQELADRRLVYANVVKTITSTMRLETMTQVQSMTINETLKGADVLAQARTGTGKTLGFLVPVLQNILKKDPDLVDPSREGRRRGSPSDIRALIISPTRELAEQIAVEAKKLVQKTGVIVQTAVGGTQKSYGLRQMQREGCHILVGTPGRLNDIFSDPRSGVKAPNLSALVLDEADRLLDQGFATAIDAIQRLLPDRAKVDRQTLLFSATVPREVMTMVRNTLKRDFHFVKGVQEGEEPTHTKVPQKLVDVGGLENLLPALLELCKREIKARSHAAHDEEVTPPRPFKAIAYFGTTADVTLAASTFRNLGGSGESLSRQHPLHPARIYEIHAKLSQLQRTKAADYFRKSHSGILFSSDVTARGMDFPDVTHVIQLGIPSSKEQYIHRIGRTGRGDKTGEGWLFISNLEAREVRYRLGGLPLKIDDSIQTAGVDMSKESQLPEDVATTLTQIGQATKMVAPTEKHKAYLALLGAYNWYNNKQTLLDAMNDLTKYGWGLGSPPSIPRGVATKLGLARLRGINIGYFDEGSDGGSNGSFGRRNSWGDSPRGRGGGSFGHGMGRDGSYGRERASEAGFGGSQSRTRDGRYDRGMRDRDNRYEPRGSRPDRGLNRGPSYGDRADRRARSDGRDF